MANKINNPAASAMLGDPAVVIRYNTGRTSERKFEGKPYSEVVCLAPYLNGELVRVTVPGVIESLTPEMVYESLCRLSFIRIKFSSDLVLDVKGDSFNKVSYQAEASHATLVQPGQK